MFGGQREDGNCNTVPGVSRMRDKRLDGDRMRKAVRNHKAYRRPITSHRAAPSQQPNRPAIVQSSVQVRVGGEDEHGHVARAVPGAAHRRGAPAKGYGDAAAKRATSLAVHVKRRPNQRKVVKKENAPIHPECTVVKSHRAPTRTQQTSNHQNINVLSHLSQTETKTRVAMMPLTTCLLPSKGKEGNERATLPSNPWDRAQAPLHFPELAMDIRRTVSR